MSKTLSFALYRSAPFKVGTFFSGVDLWLEVVENRGMAWGTFTEYFDQLLLLRFLILFFLLLFFLRSSRFLIQVGVAFLLAGALGNLWDMIWNGYVIDMIHFIFWGKSFGIFNLADCYIAIGGVLLMMAKKISIPC